jgi:hypothetical protein
MREELRMNMRLVVPPPGPSIVLRSLGYGAGYGAAAGTALLAVSSLYSAVVDHDVTWLGAAIMFSVFAAILGAVVGVACGLVGGIALVVLRQRAAASRAGTRLIAGAGAALVPGVCTALLNRPDAVVLGLALSLTLMTFGIGVAIGPRVLYGRPPRRRRPPAE